MHPKKPRAPSESESEKSTPRLRVRGLEGLGFRVLGFIGFRAYRVRGCRVLGFTVQGL